MKTVTKRNGTIEFLRFLCCIIIVVDHSKKIFPDDIIDYLPLGDFRGALAVEFFFLISGYLMACSAAKYLATRNENDGIGTATVNFIKRKVSALLPTLFVAFAFSFVVGELSKNVTSVVQIAKDFMISIWSPLLLEVTGLGKITELWYISAMILVMLVLYPLCIKNFDTFVNIVAPVIAFFLIGWLVKNQGSLLNPAKYLDFAYKGLVRAFGEIALGAALYPIIQKLSKLDVSKKKSIVLSLIQFICWILVLGIVFFASNGKYDAFALLLVAISVCISFSHKDSLADFMDNKFFIWLGKMSLTLYLSHKWIALAMKEFFEGADYVNEYFKLCGIYLALVVLATGIIYNISKLIKNHYMRGKN